MQTKRQWMVTHEWMVKPMQQKEWIQGQGLLIWFAEVFSSLGTGLYLVSIFVNNWWGALFGWLIIVLIKLPLHIAYLGKPTRFWRAMPPFTRAWRTSWIARGVFFTTLFAGFAFLQLISTYLLVNSSSLSGLALNTMVAMDMVLKILAGTSAVLTAMYSGFMMSFCKSIPFWNTGLLPIVIMNAGIADGLALLTGLGLWTGGIDFLTLETASRVVLVVNTLLIVTYLLNATYQSVTAELSVKELIAGRLAVVFWLGVIILGIIAPLALTIPAFFGGEISQAWLIIAVVSHTLGAFALKYCILKVGIYRPLLPRIYIY